MSDILSTIAAHARVRVAAAKSELPLEALIECCRQLPPRKSPHRFHDALNQPGLRFICELKKASPSKGLISPDFPYLSIARDYEEAGADAISCLTEPKWFLGSDAIFSDVRQAIALPMLRKDFTVDEYQLYEARLLGADAVLLIAALLDTATIARYLDICASLGLDALVETHNAEEIASAVSADAGIIGVNNRNLKNFTVDFGNAARLRELIPAGKLYVAESGVRGPDDVRQLKAIGADAVLMGEVLMRASDSKKMLRELRESGDKWEVGSGK